MDNAHRERYDLPTSVDWTDLPTGNAARVGACWHEGYSPGAGAANDISATSNRSRLHPASIRV